MEFMEFDIPNTRFDKTQPFNYSTTQPTHISVNYQALKDLTLHLLAWKFTSLGGHSPDSQRKASAL